MKEIPLTAHQSPQNGEDTPESSGTNLNAHALFRQLALQGAAVIAVLSLAWPYFGLRNEPLPWPETAFAIGFMAFIFARLGKRPFWLQLVHAGLAPLVWLIHGYHG